MSLRRKLTPADQLDFWPPAQARPALPQSALVIEARRSSFWFHGEDLFRWVRARIADRQQAFVLAFLDNGVVHRIGGYTAEELICVRELLADVADAGTPCLSSCEDRRAGVSALGIPALNPDSFFQRRRTTGRSHG